MNLAITNVVVSSIPGLIVGLIVGVLIAIFTVWLTERAARERFSKLVQEGIVRQKQSSQIVWRLKVRNGGLHPARDVRADVEKIVSNDTEREGVITAPLNWAHNPSGLFTRDIFTNQTAYLDICVANLEPKYRPEELKLANFNVASIEESSTVWPGSTKIHIGMYQGSGQRISAIISFDWNGGFKEEDLKAVKTKIKSFEEIAA